MGFWIFPHQIFNSPIKEKQAYHHWKRSYHQETSITFSFPHHNETECWQPLTGKKNEHTLRGGHIYYITQSCKAR